jgi:Holliday junction resolvase
VTTFPRVLDAEAEIADRYVAQGYDIIRSPSPDDLPATVGPYVPDLVAVRGDERVAVEIVRRPDATRIEELKSLASVFRNAGWRLDVVVLGRNVAESEQPRYLPPARLRERLRVAEQTTIQGRDLTAGLILAWTAIEAALRQLIGNSTAETSPMASARLIKEALSLGILQQRDWAFLNELLAARNRAVHGEEMAGSVDRKSLRRALNLAHRLANTLDGEPARRRGA